VDVDTSAYDQGHVPGAVGWNWQTQLQDTLRRDLADQRSFGQLAGSAGILPETTVILYGDNNNWFAAWGFWQLKYYGHTDVRLMNGGRKKWLEEKRPISTDAPKVQPTTYSAKSPDTSIRAKREDIFSVLERRSPAQLVDVRSPDEFSGKVIAPPGMTETAQRGGHIPGAASIPWAQAVAEDGTFKPADALRQLYGGKGVTGEQEVIAYCRIGERSSHTWFVLKYLLGTRTSATTMGRGPNGATWWERRSKRKSPPPRGKQIIGNGGSFSRGLWVSVRRKRSARACRPGPALSKLS